MFKTPNIYINLKFIIAICIPLSVLGVSSHRFLLALGVPWCPGVSLPGVTAPGVACPGVASHILVLCPGVAPGVSDPLGRPGVSSHRVFDGVSAPSHAVLLFDFFAGVSSDAWSHRRFFFSCADCWTFCDDASPDDPFTTWRSPDLAFSTIWFCRSFYNKQLTILIILQNVHWINLYSFYNYEIFSRAFS